MTCPLFGQSQNQHERALNYILKYKEIAIQEMHRTGIPASIKLGQGLLESNIGTSRLATQANNHFGAKCHNTWYGETIKHDDDAPQECFRRYASAHDSYIDHSYVLAKDRYQSLYQLNVYDYTNWAIGLKAAGYATDPNYASKLINMIERYALFVYDRMEHYPNSEIVMVDNQAKMKFDFVSIERKEFTEELVPPLKEVTKLQKRATKKIGQIEQTRIQLFNKVPYVVYDKTILPVQASNAYGLTLSELLDFNYAELNHEFNANERIYLKRMRKRAPRKNRIHQMSEEETMRDVALRYAMDIDALYVLNSIPYGSQPKVGEILYLRKHNPVPPACTPTINQVEPTEQSQTEKEQVAIVEQVLSTPAQTRASFENPSQENVYVAPNTTASIVSPPSDFHTASVDSSTLAYNQRNEILQVQLDGMMDFDFDKKTPVVVSPPLSIKTVEGTESSTKSISNVTANHGKSSESNSSESGQKVYHTIKSGDTLSEIAEEYEVTVSKLKQLNNLKSTVIKIGQKLRVK